MLRAAHLQLSRMVLDERGSLLSPENNSTSTSSLKTYGSIERSSRMDTSVDQPEATSSATTFPPPAKSPHLDQPEPTSPSPLPQAFIPSQGTSDLRRRAGKEKATIGKRRRLPRVAFELENRGSVARDHLASERTFLAWLRTSLALASIGIGEYAKISFLSTTTFRLTVSLVKLSLNCSDYQLRRQVHRIRRLRRLIK
jgi:hypothetical protein